MFFKAVHVLSHWKNILKIQKPVSIKKFPNKARDIIDFIKSLLRTDLFNILCDEVGKHFFRKSTCEIT